MKKILSITLNILIAGIIVFWAYILYQNYNQLPADTVQTRYLFFTIKILLFSLFLIASLSLTVFLNQLQLNSSQTNQTEENVFVSTSQPTDTLPELEVIRKILDQKLQVIDQLWEQSIHSEDKEKSILGEESLLNLLEAQKKLLKPTTLKSLIIETVETVSDFTGSKRVSLFLYDKENNRLSMAYGKGFSDQNVSVEIKDSIDGYVFENGKRIFVTNIETHPELGRDNKAQYQTKSFIVFPLKLSTNKIIGVLNLTEKDGTGMYSMMDLEKINLLLNQSLLKMEIIIHSNKKSLDNPIDLQEN